jgi:hypothetical protein
MRQYKSFVLVIQVILLAQTAYSGFERTAQPVSVIGRGLSGSAMFHFDNVLINPASISAVASLRSSIFYSPSPFQLPQLSGYGLLVGTPISTVYTAVGFHTFGFSLYRETDGFISAGTMLSDGTGIGMNLHLYHLTIERYGSASAGVLDMGGIFRITEAFALGGAIHNLTGADFGDDDDIPRTLLTGISVSVSGNAVVNVDMVKEMRYPVTFRIGTEVMLHENLTVRAGVQEESSRIFWGMSVILIPFRIGYSYAAHSELGPSHSIGISIE